MTTICSKCKQDFIYPSELKRHLKRKTSCIEKKQSKCLRCHKLFSRPSDLARHANRKNPCEIIKTEAIVIAEQNTIASKNILKAAELTLKAAELNAKTFEKQELREMKGLIQTTIDRLEYIYLLREREFIRIGEHIYKIGKTTQENLGRFNQYPKGSKLLYQNECGDCHTMERKVIELFREKYIQRTDIGIEYFEGDPRQMINDIHTLINEEFNVQSEDNSDSEWSEEDNEVLAEKAENIENHIDGLLEHF